MQGSEQNCIVTYNKPVVVAERNQSLAEILILRSLALAHFDRGYRPVSLSNHYPKCSDARLVTSPSELAKQAFGHDARDGYETRFS